MPDAADAAPVSGASPTAPADAAPAVGARPRRLRGVAGSIWALEHAQDLLAVVVGVLLVLLAGTLMISSVAEFVHTAETQSVARAEPGLLDRILLVLILVEIVHTVVLSLRAHRLAAQPFIVVGLVAVIRRILFLLSNEVQVNTTELALLIAMLVAFIAGLIAVRYFDRRVE